MRYNCELAGGCLRCDNSVEELQERGLTRSDGTCRRNPDACQIIKDNRAKEKEALQKQVGDKLPARTPCCDVFNECDNAESNEYCDECSRNWDNDEYGDYFDPKKAESPPVKVEKKTSQAVIK